MGHQLLAARVRSGLAETFHYGAVAVSDRDGSLIAWAGDVDRPFYLRSAAKPFQAHVSQEAGAGLQPVELAVAAASHRGHPVQLALVESILEGGGLGTHHLLCPPAWPFSTRSGHRLVAEGSREPRRLWHNCSGKHAAFLRGCAARGWHLGSYLDPGHPLQRRVISLVSDLGGHSVEPVGVDGCGAPVLRTTTRVMARLFARLATEDALHPVFDAMHRYPALVSAGGMGDSSIATVIHAAAKGGAEGCLGVAVCGLLGVAVKSWDGLGDVAAQAAIAALDKVGALPGTAAGPLEKLASPPVRGGGRQVGVMESRLELSFT